MQGPQHRYLYAIGSEIVVATELALERFICCMDMSQNCALFYMSSEDFPYSRGVNKNSPLSSRVINIKEGLKIDRKHCFDGYTILLC